MSTEWIYCLFAVGIGGAAYIAGVNVGVYNAKEFFYQKGLKEGAEAYRKYLVTEYAKATGRVFAMNEVSNEESEGVDEL